MCFKSERYSRWSSPSVKNIADIAPVSRRCYLWVKRKLADYINSHRKQEDGLSRMHMKPGATEANAAEANAAEANAAEANAIGANIIDAPRPTADEDRNSIQVNVVDHLFLAQFGFPGMDLTALALLGTRGIVLGTATWDKKKLGTQEEALCAHPPSAIRRLDATLPGDLQKLVMRSNQGRASRCAV